VEVAYDSGTPALDEGWGPKPDQWKLFKGFPATATPLIDLDSTNHIMLATWGPITDFLCKFDADITARSGTTIGSGTASLYYLSGSTLTDTTVNLTVYNISSTKATSGRYGSGAFKNGIPLVDVESCA
jgi:hypothetical protein